MTVLIFNSSKVVSSRNAEAGAVGSIQDYHNKLNHKVVACRDQMSLLRALVSEANIDHLYITGGYGKLFLIFSIFPILRLLGIKIICRYTGDYFNVYRYEKRILKKIRCIIKYNILHFVIFYTSTCILTAGPKSRLYCKKLFNKRKVFFLPTPVDLSYKSRLRFNGNDEHKTTNLLFVGGFEYEKGFDLFLDLAKELAFDDNFHFTCVGFEKDSEFNDIDYIKNRNISVFPAVSKEKLAEFYADSDVLIFLSRISQGFGQVALEAVSLGLSVVTLDHNWEYSDVNWRYKNKFSNTADIIDQLNFGCLEKDEISFIDTELFWKQRFTRIIDLIN